MQSTIGTSTFWQRHVQLRGRELVEGSVLGKRTAFHTSPLHQYKDKDGSLKGGQETLISLGHKSDSNLCKQNLVLVLDKYLWEKRIRSKKSQSVSSDGQRFFELHLFLRCQKIEEREELCGYLDAFGTWFYFRAALVVSSGSIGGTFSCSTIKCAEPSSDLLGECLKTC